MRQSGGALWHAAAVLKADPEVVLEAVKEDGGALWYASAKLKSDREFVLRCVAVNGVSLRYVATTLKGDREIVLAAIAQDRTALRYASADLQRDREIVHAARPPVSTPQPAVVVVQGTAVDEEEPTASPDDALEAARLAQRRRARGMVKAQGVAGLQEDSPDANTAATGWVQPQLVLHTRNGSGSSDISTDEDFATVRSIPDATVRSTPGASAPRPRSGHHRRLGSRDSELDGAATVLFATPHKPSAAERQPEPEQSAEPAEAQQEASEKLPVLFKPEPEEPTEEAESQLQTDRTPRASFKATGLIGLALARMQPSRERADEAQDSGSGSPMSGEKHAPLPSILFTAETPLKKTSQVRPQTPQEHTHRVSFAPGTTEQSGSRMTKRRRRSSMRLMLSGLSNAATDVNVPTEPALRSPSGRCECKRRNRDILMGLLRCFCLFCACCGLPVIALIAMETGAVSDCNEIGDSACWRQFVEASIGIEFLSCKSEKSCDQLRQEYGAAMDAGEPVERSDGAILESDWSFLDEPFGLADITCIEGSAVSRHGAVKMDELYSECTGVADPIAVCTDPTDRCVAIGMTSCGGFADVCVPNGAAVPDCSDVYAVAGDGRKSSCPAGCNYVPTSRCQAGLESGRVGVAVTQSKAESICRQSFGARLCTGYELWRSGTGCFVPFGVPIEADLPVWSRTPANQAFTTMGLMESCPTVDEETPLFVAYKGTYAADPLQKLLCLDGSQELGLVRCCADVETEECESDRTGVAYDDGSWEETGSWNLTAYEEDYATVNVAQTVVAGSVTFSYLLCLAWVCFMGRKCCLERYRKSEQLRREADELQQQLQEKEEMRVYGINQGLTGDIEDQQLGHALRQRSLSTLSTLRLKGLTTSPSSKTNAVGQRDGSQWANPSAGAPRGCSLSDLPDRAKILILSHTADCAELARLSVVCKWWHALHRTAARHVNIRWSQWEESDATLDAIGYVLPSYSELMSVDIVADAPRDGCRTKPDPTNADQPILVVGTCAASAALWEYASIRSLTLRAAPLMIESWCQGPGGGRVANGGPKSTGTIWHLDRNFSRVIARSRTLTSLDLRRSTFDQITGWPSSLELLCLQQCTQMEVLPGDLHTFRSLVSLDVSLCPMLYDVSVLLGAASLQWLDLSGCSRLCELSPIAGCSNLRSLNLNRCFSLREVSALGTLFKLETLDLSSCPLVEDIINLCACETTQLGGSWCKALIRLDLSYTGVSDVACLAPIDGLDGTLFRGCPHLRALSARGCKALEYENLHELLCSNQSLQVDLGSPRGPGLDIDTEVSGDFSERIHDNIRSSVNSGSGQKIGTSASSHVAGDKDRRP